MIDAFTGTLYESIVLLARMAPYLLLGLGVAGIIHVLLPVDFISRQLGSNSIGAVLKAATLGVPLPLCSCGVVPVAASLKKNGASPGATVGFLVTTPTSGVDSILATYSLLGLPITIARVLASFVIGILAGIATTLFGEKPTKKLKQAGSANASTAPGNRVREAIVYAFGELLEGIARPLAIGCLLGGAIAWFLPPDLLGETVGTGLLSYLVMLGVGIPLYVCASGSIPLAAALLVKGISPGAALIFLIAGPATNAATVTVVSDMLGKRTLFLYLAVLVLGSLGAGYATDLLFGAFPAFANFGVAHVHDHEGIHWIEIASAVILGSAMLYHLARPIITKFNTMKAKDMTEFTVPDMTCAHCAGTIEKAATAVEGVTKVHADPSTKKVHIDATGTQAVNAALDAIKSAGYHPE